MMNFEQLQYNFQYSSALRVLRTQNAPFTLAFLHEQFKRHQRRTIPREELEEQLAGFLHDLTERDITIYTRTPREYLREWSEDLHLIGFVRVGVSNAYIAELLPDGERVLRWLEDLNEKGFIGTESRFLQIFALLDELVTGTVDDPAVRRERLIAEREAVQQQIDLLEQTGELRLLSSTQVRERFFQLQRMVNDLLSDFAAIEHNFYQLARDVQHAQVAAATRKGDVISRVLNADQQLRQSDQGRSFYAFWAYLTSSEKQDELHTLLEAVFDLPEIVAMPRQQYNNLRRVDAYLIEAGQKIDESNRRLAEQIRRILDDRNLIEGRRVREVIREIKQLAFQLKDQVNEADFMYVEETPDVVLPLERPLFEPPEVLHFSSIPEPFTEIDWAASGIGQLFSHQSVNKQELRGRINQFLALKAEVSLPEIVTRYPIEQGLEELLAYLEIAAHDGHLIDLDQRMAVPIDTQRTLLMPRIVFRKDYIQHDS